MVEEAAWQVRCKDLWRSFTEQPEVWNTATVRGCAGCCGPDYWPTVQSWPAATVCTWCGGMVIVDNGLPDGVERIALKRGQIKNPRHSEERRGKIREWVRRFLKI
jgi:hypothetical protein